MEDLNVQTIAIPVEEYKELLQKQAELSLIYHKVQAAAFTTLVTLCWI